MKKFKVIYTDCYHETDVFKVIAEDKTHAVAILRRKIPSAMNVIRVIEVKDNDRRDNMELKIIIACTVAFILLVTLVVMTSCSIWETHEPIDYIKYVVSEGDSLWYIGSHSNGWNILDNTQVVNDIQEESNCTSIIYPGQVVYIPVYDLD